MAGQASMLDFHQPGFSTRGQKVRAARAANWHAETATGIAVLRHRQAGLLLRDRRLRQGAYSWPRTQGLSGSFADFWERSLIAMEGARHKALRTAAGSALSRDFIDGLRASWSAIAAELADTIGARAEFMSAFATPFSGRAIATLVHGDPSRWRALAYDAIMLGRAMTIGAKVHEAAINAACNRLLNHADVIIDAQDRYSRGYPARLAAAMPAPDRDALRDLLVISIFGGVDTTRAQLGFLLHLLATHPAQWDALRRNPDLVPAAIEEAIRHRPTTTWATREALEDFEIDGLNIRKGQSVHILVHATATDPALGQSENFDITATRKPHFGFGGGAHHCLGQLVARTDMACALHELVRCFRRIEPAGKPRFQPDLGNTAPIALPLRFIV